MRGSKRRGEWIIAIFWATLILEGGTIGITLLGVMEGLPSPSLTQTIDNLIQIAIIGLVMIIGTIAITWKESK